MHTPGPYEPCYCKSGKKYKYCHYPIDIAPTQTRRELSQQMYVERWSKSSEQFRSQGCYTWMASQLLPYSPKYIFDVGCGDGTGLISLKAACGSESRIISCDDNLECLRKAHDQMRKCGIDVKLINRLKQSDAGDGFHTMTCDLGKLQLTRDYAEVILIEADVLWDAEFKDFLVSLPKFDAITVWLIGTYDLKPECRNIQASDPGIYRLKVQNEVYRLADRILRKGGVLQIVDRGEVPNEDFLKEDNIQSHQEQAQGTSLKVDAFQFREYQEMALGVTMMATIAKSGRTPDLSQLAITSIISVKH